MHRNATRSDLRTVVARQRFRLDSTIAWLRDLGRRTGQTTRVIWSGFLAITVGCLAAGGCTVSREQLEARSGEVRLLEQRANVEVASPSAVRRLPESESSATDQVVPAAHTAVVGAAPINPQSIVLPDQIATRGTPSESSLEPLSVMPPPIEGSVTATDCSTPLALVEFEQMALAANPTIAEAAAQVDALRGRWVQVGLLPNPTLGYLGEEMGSLGTTGMQGGYVSQQFIRGGQLWRAREVVAWQLDQAEQELAAQQQRVITDVQLAYYRLAMAEQRLEATTEIVRLNEQAVEASQALLDAGETTQIQLIQAELEAERASILRSNAAAQRTAAQRQLRIVVGMPEMPLPQIDAAVGEPNEIAWDVALHRVLNQSPEMAAAMTNLQRARSAVDLARARAKTNVTVQVAIQRDTVDGDTLTGVQAGLPIPIFNRNQGGVDQSFGELVAAERGIQRLELALGERLNQAYQRYEQARYQVGQYTGRMLARAREGLDLTTEGYRAGEIDYLTFLTSQRTYFQTRLAYIQSLEALWSATIEIDGLLLSDSLQTRS